MLKNSHDRILRREPKEQYLSTVPKSCPIRKYTWIKHLWFIEKKKKKHFTCQQEHEMKIQAFLQRKT